jgi:predicted ATPase/DNA-binding CsgD family transcriptional regulator
MLDVPRHCAACGAELSGRPGGSAREALYCSNACRQRAYRERRRAERFPPSGPGSNPRSLTIPLALDSFVGRRQELAAVRRLLRSGRLVTLFGPAGVGKTRLALELASRVAPGFPGGVHLVELGPLTRPEFVVRAVASAFGVSEQPGTPLVDTVVTSMQDERTLVILDNCEHLVEACGELVVLLLRRCAGLHAVATSREALRVPGELVFASGELPIDDAVQLFADRAHAVAPAFDLDLASRAQVERICARLDRLPLAIELAARLVRVLPLDDIADGLRDRFELLTSRTRGVDPRQRDLLTAIEWSYKLLPPVEQAVFARLAMLPGGFDFELVRAVCADLGLTVTACRELISSLESKSLVTSTHGSSGRARFRQLESVREYAQRRLIESGDWDATAERLVSWLTDMATPLLDQFVTTMDVRGGLDIEYGNLLRAVEHLAGGTDGRQLLLIVALGRCHDGSGIAGYGREQLAEALRIEGAPVAYRCLALAQAAWLAARYGDHDAAVALGQQAVDLAREHGPSALLGRALMALAYARLTYGEFAEAIECFTECLAQARNLGQPETIALCLNNLAWANVLTGDTARARDLIVEALETIHREDADAKWVAALRHTAGMLALEQDALSDAEREFGESLRILGSRSSGTTPFALEGLGMAALRDGRRERGLRLVGAADTIRRRSGVAGDPWWRERLANAVAAGQVRLPPGRAQALRQEGRRLTAAQAIGYALRDRLDPGATRAAPPVPLTRREQDVAALVTQGLTNRDIGERLRVSERTVEAHLDRIRTKLGVRSRAQVAAWAAGNVLPPRAATV